MKDLLAAITDLDALDIVNTLYSFIRNKGKLPTDEAIFNIFQQSDTLTDAYHEINRLSLVCLKEALLQAVLPKNRATFSQLIVIEEKFIEGSPSLDGFTLRFKGQVFHNPSTNALEYFYKYLNELDKKVFYHDASLQGTFSISVSPDVVTKIKAVVEVGILEPTVDSSCGNSTATVLELRFIKEMAQTNQNFADNLKHIWQVLTDYKPELQNLKEFDPDFLVLYASEENAIQTGGELIDKAKALLERADQGEWVRLQDGVWVSSAETNQEAININEYDDLKGFDFSEAPYWITTDTGSIPIAVHHCNDDSLLEIISKNMDS